MCYVWSILVVSRGLNLLLWKESKLNFRIWATASVSKACVFTQKEPCTIVRAHWNAATDSSKCSAGDRKWHMGFCLGCAPLLKDDWHLGTVCFVCCCFFCVVVCCNKFPSWMRQKGPGSIGAAREYWVAPFREGIQLYPSTFPHYPSLHLVMQNGNGTGKSGELCLNPRVRSMHGDMYQVVLLNFLMSV